MLHPHCQTHGRQSQAPEAEAQAGAGISPTPRLLDLHKAIRFYLIALTLATGIALIPSLSGDAVLLLSPLTPLAAVLLMLLVVTRDGHNRAGWQSLGLHRLGARTWPFALLAPVVVLSCAYGIFWLTSFANPRPPSTSSPADFVLNLVVGFFVTLVFALAEELGWRGYLLPRLLFLGARRATLVTGFLHGVWHLPAILLTTAYHPLGNRLIVVPLFVLALTLAGPIYGYLRLASGSIWPSTIAHASLNVTWSVFMGLTVASSPVAAEYLAGETGVLPVIGYAMVAAWCWHRLGSRPSTPMLAQAQAPSLS